MIVASSAAAIARTVDTVVSSRRPASIVEITGWLDPPAGRPTPLLPGFRA